MKETIVRMLFGFLLFASLLISPLQAQTPPATIVITFDYWPTTYTEAFTILAAKGIPATWYVAPGTIGKPRRPRLYQLANVLKAGWEIGIYSNKNMVDALASNRELAKQWMASQKSQLLALGIDAKSYAPNRRAWNSTLADMSRGIYENVRAADGSTAFQTYPIPDRNNVRNGITDSLSLADTPERVCAYVDRLAASPGTMAVLVIHKVGAVGDAYTVTTKTFTALAGCIQTAVAAGTLRAVTFSQALTPP